jgi:DNA-binding NarL/FixJ family response regulator
MPINLTIVDDQALFRDGLKTFLDLEPDLAIISTAATGKKTLALLNPIDLPM